MYEQMHANEMRAKLFNRMHEILGTDERDEYTVKGTMSKAIDTVNKMMNIK